MTAVAVAFTAGEIDLPLPLLLAPAKAFDESPLQALERETAARAATYDPQRQTGLFDINMSKSKCSGICCVYSGGFDFSQRDQVSDD